MFRNKVAAKHPGLSAAERRPRQRALARRNVAAEDNLDSVSLAHRQPVADLAKREAQESRDGLGSVSRQPRRRPVEDRVKRAVDEREARAPMVNPAVNQEAERQLRQSAARDNRSAERKRERGPHRQDHNKSSFIFVAAPERNSSGAAGFNVLASAVGLHRGERPTNITAALRFAPRSMPRL
jgi:hypothetical protein